MQIANLVTKWLVEGEYPIQYPTLPSAVDIPEPTVVRQGAYERVAVGDGEERGIVTCSVYVVREVEADADAAAQAMERWVRRCEWDRWVESWPWRVVEVDTTAPCVDRRDSSGRYVWRFDVLVTVVRVFG